MSALLRRNLILAGILISLTLSGSHFATASPAVVITSHPIAAPISAPVHVPMPAVSSTVQNTLTEYSGDDVIISGSGTTGVYEGQPINSNTSTYTTSTDEITASLDSGSTFTLQDGGSISNTTSGTSLFVDPGSTAFINGGTLSGDSGIDNFGTLVMNSGIVLGNSSFGAAGISSYGEAVIKGGTIEGTGPGLFVSGGTTLVMGGTITGDTNSSIYCLSGNLEVTSGMLPNGISVVDGTAFIAGGNVSNGIYAASVEPSTPTTVCISGGTISGVLQINQYATDSTVAIDLLGSLSATDENGNPISSPITGHSGTITGKLLNGQPINVDYVAYSGTIEFNVGPPPVIVDVAIATPYDDAVPQSNYVALTGIGPVGSKVAVLVDGVADGSKIAQVDSNGQWEKLVYTGSGFHTLAVENTADTDDVSEPISVTTSPLNAASSDTIAEAADVLQKADIFLARTNTSIEVKLYGPNYTHTALYLGGDEEGTPLVSEALPDWRFVNEGGVRTVPIDASSIVKASIVDVYRPIVPISRPIKNQITNQAKVFVNNHPSYWFTDTLGFWPFRQAREFWDFDKDQPEKNRSALFNKALNQLDINKNAADRFICSTLVWHAYLFGTSGSLDLSTPNNASLQGGYIEQFGLIDSALNKALQPHFVFPDTLALDGKLQKVN